MCALNLSHGTDGIRQSDYRVYVINKNGFAAISADVLSVSNFPGIYDLYGEFNAAMLVEVAGGIEDILAAATPIGHFRRDSIEIAGEEGNTIELNESGEVSLSKQCSFVAELINTTKENIADLQELSRDTAVFILEELNPQAGRVSDDNFSIYEYEDLRRFIILANTSMLAGDFGVKFSVSEKATGGDVARATITAKMDTGRVSNFRILKDIILDCVTIGSNQDMNTCTAKFDIDVINLAINPVGIETLINIDAISGDDIEVRFVPLDGKKRNFTFTAEKDDVLQQVNITVNVDNNGEMLTEGDIVKVRFKPTVTLSGLYSMWISFEIESE